MERGASYASKQKEQDVSQTSEIRTLRQYVCGCLDSCSNDGGSGTSVAKKKKLVIAMQTPMLEPDGRVIADRVYTLAREEKSEDYEIKCSNGKSYISDVGTKSLGNIRGYPERPDSNWIGISLKNKNEDYVYIMGPETIKDWYKKCWNGHCPANMLIKAVGVSNRWDQKGGIVYAYDKNNRKIYKFTCEDSKSSNLERDPGVSNMRFVAISADDVISAAGGDGKTCEVEDLKADGYGNVYLGLDFPSKNPDTFRPEEHFQSINAVHICIVATDLETGYYSINVVFKQEYGKVVVEKNAEDGTVRKVGGRPYAWTYYNTQIAVSPERYSELAKLKWPNSEWLSIILKYSAKDSKMDVTNNNWRKNIYYGNGGCAHGSSYTNYTNRDDAGQCRLAVVNIPTPPNVLHLGDTYRSYLDIIGPYDEYPKPNIDDRHTNQGTGLLKSSSALQLDKVYFYMVENYPIHDEQNITAQDPRTHSDWDEDGRQGGFISSVRSRQPYRPKTNENGIKYEWKTWMVMDLYGNSCCRLVQSKDVKDAYHYNYIYSPVFGKFIMTCKVNYSWYNYDKVPFGGNIEDAHNGLYSGVVNTNEWAYPTASRGESGSQSDGGVSYI